MGSDFDFYNMTLGKNSIELTDWRYTRNINRYGKQHVMNIVRSVINLNN